MIPNISGLVDACPQALIVWRISEQSYFDVVLVISLSYMAVRHAFSVFMTPAATWVTH
jgi:hypothetical protein